MKSFTSSAIAATQASPVRGIGYDRFRKPTGSVDSDQAFVDAHLDTFPELRHEHYRVLDILAKVVGVGGLAADIGHRFLESSSHERILDALKSDLSKRSTTDITIADGVIRDADVDTGAYDSFRNAISIGTIVALSRTATQDAAGLLVRVRRLRAAPKSLRQYVDRQAENDLGQTADEIVATLGEALGTMTPHLERLVAHQEARRRLDELGISHAPGASGASTDIGFARPLPSINSSSRDVLLAAGAGAIRFASAEGVLKGLMQWEGQDPEAVFGGRNAALGVIAANLRKSTTDATPESQRTEAWEREITRAITWIILFAARWAMQGFPVISPTHKLAASNMATSIPPELVPEVWMPWRTFLVEVPSGLMPDDIRYVGIMDMESFDEAYREATNGGDGSKSVAGFIMLLFPHLTARPRAFTLSSIADLADMRLGDNVDYAVNDEAAAASPRDQRVLELLGRLVLGTLIELDSEDHKDRAGRKPPNSVDSDERVKRGDKLPSTWAFVIKRDVKHDVRDFVGDYLAGKRSGKLTVQVLVRGHRKRQPYGPKGSLRRWQHIEPYWRGPEDAPIAMRAHVVGGKEGT